ncbi:MAG: tetratricopeptide repeat protein [Candidatus Celaenobacter polaris]|nr:tetratricopeptide repeat protein [Candidatus Celaenobacter polaris]
MKKYLPIFLVVIAVLVLAACQSMYMRTARLAIRDEDDPDKAIENLKKEIEANPGNADAYLFMSQIFGQFKEDYYQSYQYAKKALEADPAKEKEVDLIYLATWSQLHNQGLEALNAENYQEALIKLNQAHEIEPDSMITFEVLGDTYVRAGDIDKALDVYLQIYDKDPESIFALNGIATIYFNQGDYDKSVEYFLVLHNLEPQNIDWLYNVWVGEIKLGNTEAAMDYAKQAIAIDPSNKELLQNIADIYFNEKNFSKAAEYYMKIIDVVDWDWKQINEWVGNAMKNTNNFNIKSKLWKIEWDTKPDEYSEGNFSISIYDDNGNLVDIVANVIGKNKDYSIIRGMGKYYLAINSTQEYVIKVFENNIEALKYLCYCLSNTKNYTDLVTYAQKWLEVEPDSTEAQQFLNLAKQMLNK